MGRAENKVVIVTGGSQGMGEAEVRKFHSEGAKVVFTDIQAEKGEALQKELGKNVKFVCANVTSRDDWKKVVAETEKTFGNINYLVNNAGIFWPTPCLELSEEDYRKVINVDQVGVFLGMQEVVPSMMKTGNGGAIVNISSISGFVGQLYFTSYNAAKFAVRGMTKAFALELADKNIRINTVHPGIVETPLMAAEPGPTEMYKDSVPMKRFGQPEEVANLVLFVAVEATYSTGSEFIIDGGYLAQ